MTLSCAPLAAEHRHHHHFPTRRSSDLVFPTDTKVVSALDRDGTLTLTLAGSFGRITHDTEHLEELGVVRDSSERAGERQRERDRKSTRLNASHSQNSYAVFRLKKNNTS